MFDLSRPTSWSLSDLYWLFMTICYKRSYLSSILFTREGELLSHWFPIILEYSVHRFSGWNLCSIEEKTSMYFLPLDYQKHLTPAYYLY